MEVEVVTGAMSTLLPKLGDLLKGEYKLQKGVRGGIKFLEAELECMQAALLKISEAPIDQPPDIQVKLWARDVKELSYDVEDTIDAFMVRIDTRAPKTLHGLMGFINRSINLLTKANVRHKIGTDIKDIKRRIMEISERRDRYKVDNAVARTVGPTIDSLRLLALYKKETELVGTEEKSDGLVNRLMEGDEASKQQLKIVSIVGFGGLGKTTLAKVVYEKLKVQFDCWAFIPVSLNPNMEKIFEDMLHQLYKHSNIDELRGFLRNRSNIDGERQLINKLRDFLQNRSVKVYCVSMSCEKNELIFRCLLDSCLPFKEDPALSAFKEDPALTIVASLTALALHCVDSCTVCFILQKQTEGGYSNFQILIYVMVLVSQYEFIVWCILFKKRGRVDARVTVSVHSVPYDRLENIHKSIVQLVDRLCFQFST